MRLKTKPSGTESGSIQKYPSLSNWKRLPVAASARPGSTKQFFRTSRELGLMSVLKSPLSSPGVAFVKDNHTASPLP
jgi:hypothetical protein